MGRMSPRARAKARVRTMAMARASLKEMTTEAKVRARKDRPRDTPVGTPQAGEVVEVGIAGMTGAIPAMAVATVEEERAAARAKARERAKDTPVGENSQCPKKKELAQWDIHEGVPHVHFSSMQPLIVHKLIEYRH